MYLGQEAEPAYQTYLELAEIHKNDIPCFHTKAPEVVAALTSGSDSTLPQILAFSHYGDERSQFSGDLTNLADLEAWVKEAEACEVHPFN